jgi:hypothetical protein
MNYHLTGLLSSFFVALSLTGIALQLRQVWQRKQAYRLGKSGGERPTAVLSLNRFFTSFFAFYTMFLYGLTLERPNLYIVSPRILALSLGILILREIQHDRRSTFFFEASLVLVFASAIIAVSPFRVTVNISGLAHVMVLAGMGLFAQGAVHQILAIRRVGRTGALSLPMHQLFLLKDAASLAFGVAMGFRSGWPVMAFHLVGLVVQVTTMWHFRWVRLSPAAQARRDAFPANPALPLAIGLPPAPAAIEEGFPPR